MQINKMQPLTSQPQYEQSSFSNTSVSLNRPSGRGHSLHAADDSKHHVATCRGINLICWQKIKACKVYQFCTRRWLFEDTSSLQNAGSLKTYSWCVLLWRSDVSAEIFSPPLDVGTRAQRGQLTAWRTKVIYF